MIMKKNSLYIWLLGVSFICSSCHDFFKESSQDEIKPSTVEDLRSVMYKEAYPYQFASDNYLMLLTDEMQCNGLLIDQYATQHANGTPVFTFNPMMFDGGEVFPDVDVNSWKIYYEKIKGCNVIIDYVSEVSGTEQEKNALLGQATLLRGFYHLKLAMIYCQAYTASGVDPKTALGVPLMLTMDLTDDYPERPSLEALYSQIEQDFLTATSLLEENYTPDNVYRVGSVAAYVLLSRFYLFRGGDEDLDKAIQYAGMAIEKGPMLSRLSMLMGTDKSIYDSDMSSEVVWCYGGYSFKVNTYFPTDAYQSIVPWSVSTELLSLYTTNDLRDDIYFQSFTAGPGGVYGEKIGLNSSYGGDHGIRMAEAYLNRAEANAELGHTDLALDDIEHLRKYRFEVEVPITVSTKTDVVQLVRQERRFELCFEQHRWFDLRRWDRPRIEHIYTTDMNSSQKVKFVLEENDKAYTLPLPVEVKEFDYNLENINRPERKGVIVQ